MDLLCIGGPYDGRIIFLWSERYTFMAATKRTQTAIYHRFSISTELGDFEALAEHPNEQYKRLTYEIPALMKFLSNSLTGGANATPTSIS